MTITATPVTQELYDYLQPLFWPEDEILRACTEDLRARGPQIQVAPEEGKLLQLLTAAVGARRVLEVGTLFGYSGIWLARALPPGGHLDTIELNSVHAEAARSWFERAGVSDRVTVHEGRALEVLPTLEGPYDVAFFDAVKAEYPAYLELALPRVRRGGLILCDNTLWRGRVADRSLDDPDVQGVRELNSRLSADPGLLSSLIPVGDGLAVALVR
jgi:predicted O-methyltransferase YrrM